MDNCEPSGMQLFTEPFSESGPFGLQFNGTADDDNGPSTVQGKGVHDKAEDIGDDEIHNDDNTDYDNLPEDDFHQRAQSATELVHRLKRTMAQRFRRG